VRIRKSGDKVLRELAGEDMYRHNPFRITGLWVSDGAEIARERESEIAAAWERGLPTPIGYHIPRWAPLPPPSQDEVRTAFAVIADPVRRLAHEFFWLWGEDDLTCGCPADVHTEHDVAVVAHMAVVELERTKADQEGAKGVFDTHWQMAGALWSVALNRPQLWTHMRHRIRVLDDPQLDDGIADQMRADLPGVLVAPLLELAMDSDDPKRLVDHARAWNIGQHAVAAELERRAADVLLRMEENVNQMSRLIEEVAGSTPSRMPDPSAFPVFLSMFLDDGVRYAALAPDSTATRSLNDRAAVLLSEFAMRHTGFAKFPEMVEGMFRASLELADGLETRALLLREQQSFRVEVRRRSSLSERLRWYLARRRSRQRR
jgi:hypothetical protein